MDLAGLDPRPKILLVVCISTLAVVWSDPLWLAGLFCVTLTIVALGRVSLDLVLWQIKGIVGMIALLFVVQCVFVRGGDPLVSIGTFTLVTVDGMTTAAGVALRLAVIVTSALILLTGDPRDYLLALVQCRVPYEIAFMVMTAVHFLPMLRDEALDVYHAVQMRGTEMTKASLRDKLGVYTRIALPIVASAMRRAEQVSLAMEARAFRACPRRTFMRRLTLAPRDTLWLVAVPLLTAASLVVSSAF